jgi:hypothetical protein
MNAMALHCPNPACRHPLGRWRPDTGRLIKARDVRVLYDRNRQLAHLQCPACETVRIWRIDQRSAVTGGGIQ